MIAVPNFMSFRFEKVRFRLGSNQIDVRNLKLIKFGTAIIGDDFHVFRSTFILSEVRLGWVQARVGYPITTHHYG